MALEQLPMLPGQRELTTRIEEHILRGGMVVLSGDSGSGRTVLCEKVVADLEDKVKAVAYLACREIKDADAGFSLISLQLFPEKSLLEDESDKSHTYEKPEARLASLLLSDASDSSVRLLVLDDVDCLGAPFISGLVRILARLGKKRTLALLACCHSCCEQQISAPLCELGLETLELTMPELTPADCVVLERAMYQVELSTRRRLVSSSSLNGNLKNGNSLSSRANLASTGDFHEASHFASGDWTLGRIHESVKKMMPPVLLGGASNEDDEEMTKKKNKLLWILGVCVALLAASLIYCVFMYVRYVEQNGTLNDPALTQNEKSVGNAAATKSEDDVVAALPETLIEKDVVVKSEDNKVSTELVVDDEALKSIENGEASLTELGEKTDLKSTTANTQKNKVVDSTSKLDSKDASLSSKAVDGSTSLKNEQQSGSNDIKAPAVSELKKDVTSGNVKATVTDEKLPATTDTEKSVVNSEFKTDIKNENKTEVGTETKTEIQSQVSPNAKATKVVDFATLDGKSYVIQIIATPSRLAAEKSAAMVSGYSTWVLKRARGDYIAVVGTFKNYAQASSAANALPSAIKKAGPWPKQVSKVRQDLSK